jgi:hypothetical protein
METKPRTERYTAVALPASLAHKIRVIAAHKNIAVCRYLESLTEKKVERDYQEVAAEIGTAGKGA